jgi:hypothetical protein
MEVGTYLPTTCHKTLLLELLLNIISLKLSQDPISDQQHFGSDFGCIYFIYILVFYFENCRVNMKCELFRKIMWNILGLPFKRFAEVVFVI